MDEILGLSRKDSGGGRRGRERSGVIPPSLSESELPQPVIHRLLNLHAGEEIGKTSVKDAMSLDLQLGSQASKAGKFLLSINSSDNINLLFHSFSCPCFLPSAVPSWLSSAPSSSKANHVLTQAQTKPEAALEPSASLSSSSHSAMNKTEETVSVAPAAAAPSSSLRGAEKTKSQTSFSLDTAERKSVIQPSVSIPKPEGPVQSFGTPSSMSKPKASRPTNALKTFSFTTKGRKDSIEEEKVKLEEEKRKLEEQQKKQQEEEEEKRRQEEEVRRQAELQNELERKRKEEEDSRRRKEEEERKRQEEERRLKEWERQEQQKAEEQRKAEDLRDLQRQRDLEEEKRREEERRCGF